MDLLVLMAMCSQVRMQLQNSNFYPEQERRECVCIQDYVWLFRVMVIVSSTEAI